MSTFSGDGLAGNVGLLGEGVLEQTGWTETVYRRLDDPEGTEHHALVRVFELPSGFRLLVGRDLDERDGSTMSFSPLGNGRSRWSSSWGWPADSSSRAACCAALTR